jgi:iron complex transport system substrate-binding protein
VSRTTLLAGALALALLTAACGDDAPATIQAPATTQAAATTEAPPAAAAFPREVLGVTIPAEPQRIVSASATHTEILFALGIGDRVVAVDLFSDYPAETADLDRIDAFNLNVEAVAGFDPDLVILSFDPGDGVAGFAALGIPAILFPTAPATLEDAYIEWMAVGEAVGAEEAAAGLVADARADIADVMSSVPIAEGEPPTYYHELGEDLYTITSSTFIGSIYAMAGLQNVADPADEAGFGYPQLSAEYLLETDPDFIFLADTVCCGQSAATLGARPGWDTLAAVGAGRVIELDDSLASRWGPRIVDFLETVVASVYAPAE